MTMLVHPGGEPASHRSEPRKTAGTTTILDPAMLKRLCLRALGPLLAIGTVAAIIGVKAAIFLSRIHT